MEPTREAYLDEWEAVKHEYVRALEKAPTLKDLLSLDTSDVGGVYKTAYEAFSLEHFDEAENLFTTLVLFDAKNRDFQTGLAATLEAREKFLPALSFYTWAASLKPSSHIYYRMGKCFMGLGDRDRATLMFELAAGERARDGVSLKDRVHAEKSRQMIGLLKGGSPGKGGRP